MSDTVIRVENLSKSYTIRHQTGERYTALRDVLANGAKSLGNRFLQAATSQRPAATRHHPPPATEEFWALNDVSFEVKQGERVGIIGRNGAGKSTLLKILSRITEPTKGRIHIKGRVASLLEVGTGFHPELTGRENIYLNGAILGMSREEIRRKFDEIVAFAEVEKFLDTPVKRYSSGMYVRLAFAVAAHLEPEILVVDEVLAVGDIAFQRKCLRKMDNIAKDGMTIIFVSHDMNSVSHLCSDAVFIDNGSIQMTGKSEDVIKAYQEFSSLVNETNLNERLDRRGEGGIRLLDLKFYDENGRNISTAIAGQPLIVALTYKSERSFSNIDFAVGFRTHVGSPLFVCMATNSVGPFRIAPGNGQVWCQIDDLPLADGIYMINVSAHQNNILYDWIERASTVDVISIDFHNNGSTPLKGHSPFLVRSKWRLKPTAV